MVKVTLEVEGMKCPMCESHVCDQLRKVTGVKKAGASHRKGQAFAIALDRIDVDALRESVLSQGYRVGEIVKEPYEGKGLFAFIHRK